MRNTALERDITINSLISTSLKFRKEGKIENERRKLVHNTFPAVAQLTFISKEKQNFGRFLLGMNWSNKIY